MILISSMERGGAFEEARQAWFQWNTIPAVRTGRVHLIDSDLIDRPSPRVIQGIEAMAICCIRNRRVPAKGSIRR